MKKIVAFLLLIFIYIHGMKYEKLRDLRNAIIKVDISQVKQQFRKHNPTLTKHDYEHLIIPLLQRVALNGEFKKGDLRPLIDAVAPYAQEKGVILQLHEDVLFIPSKSMTEKELQEAYAFQKGHKLPARREKFEAMLPIIEEEEEED